ncbi:MAG TPA: Fic family protein [Conexibacter sp.]|jgi:death-on-curing protein|nr:Fic family protein [Conexibacter sp.]
MVAIELEDFLLLAEAVTGLDAAALADAPHVVARAESALAAPFAEFDGIEFYEGLAIKAAVLCSRLLRNHPLPDGNKRVAYLSMIELIRRNGHEWAPIAADRERSAMVERLAAREIEEGDFATWLEDQIRSPREHGGERPRDQPERR